MTLTSTSRPAIRGRVIPRLPATLAAAGGLAIEKVDGVWTFSPDWSVLSLLDTLPDPDAKQLWVYDPVAGDYSRLSVQTLIDSLPEGPAGDDGSLIFSQNSAPSTSNPEGSLWIDADSADLDLYQLVSSVWTDTGVNLKGPTGATGASFAATSTSSQSIGSSGTKTFTTQSGLAYQAGTRVRAADAAAPSTNWMEGVVSSYSGTTLAFTADKSAGSGTLTNWVINVAGQPGADGASDGDVVGPASSTDNAVARFDGTTGKLTQNSAITIDDSGNVAGVAAASITTIELGHASDTTLARVSAGKASIEGDTIATAAANNAFTGANTFDKTQAALSGTITDNSAANFSTKQSWVADVNGSAFDLLNPSAAPTNDKTFISILFTYTTSHGVTAGTKFKSTGWTPTASAGKKDQTFWRYDSTADQYWLVGVRTDVAT